jgi:hypothetical protein
MNKILCLLFLVSALSAEVICASEVDNFTNREIPLNDSREILNLRMQKIIDKSINKTNRKYNCEQNTTKAQNYFYKNLYAQTGGFLWATYENEINANKLIDKRFFQYNKSIYRDLNLINGFAHQLVNLGSVVNVGGNYVGTDKIGHFIGIGKLYFDLMRNRNKSLKTVMNFGVMSERTFFGYTTTGFFSYGDLVSNYEGLLFWQSLFGGEKPYLNCESGKLIQIRDFDWLDYITESWDESINCSTFRNNKIKNKVYRYIETSALTNLKCPIKPMLPETIERYFKLPVKILNNQL